MKKLHKIIVMAALLVAGINNTYALGFCLVPYVGLDAQYRDMAFRRDFGAKNFRNRYPQGNFFVGLKFCDYIGIETGYFSTPEQSRESFFEAGERDLGVVDEDPARIIGVSRIQGWHINAVGFIPVWEEYCLSALVFVGMSDATVTLRNITTEIAGVAGEINIPLRQRKQILRAGVGFLHMITDYFGVRLTATWENTSKFNAIRPTVRGDDFAKIRDSYILGLGIFASF